MKLWTILVLAIAAGASSCGSDEPTGSCNDVQGGPGTSRVRYQAVEAPQLGPVTAHLVEDAGRIVCERLDALHSQDVSVRTARNTLTLTYADSPGQAHKVAVATASFRLEFYDWEPNVLGRRGPDSPLTGATALFHAVKLASKSKPKAEKTDVPPDNPRQLTPEQADRQNDTAQAKYYLFGANKQLITGPASSCQEACDGGLPAGSQLLKVPRGIAVVEAERARDQPARIKRYFVLEDDSELSGTDVKRPAAATDQQTREPIVSMNFTDTGRVAFARATKREAERGSKQLLPPGTPRSQAFQRFAITLDNKVVALATIDFAENPDGVDGRTGAQIYGVGTPQEARQLAGVIAAGALPVDLVRR